MEDELNDFEKAIVSLSWLATKCNYRDKLFIVKRVADIEKVIRLSQEAEQLRKRLAELETLLAQANNKIKWYERTEATND